MIGVVGSLARDRFPGRPGYTVGGGAYHGARALRLLGTPAIVVTRCGAEHCAELLAPLEALGVPVAWEGGGHTATFAISYDGDVRTMEIDELGDPWSVDDVGGWAGAALAGVEWVHVAPLARSDFDARTLGALARERPLSLDGQGLVREPRTGPLQLDAKYDPRALEHVTMLKLSDEEADVLGDPGALPVGEVIVTHGSLGATVYAGGTVEHVSADPIDADPTGTGDAFCVAYAAARAAGEQPAAAARLATLLVAKLLRG